MIFSTTYHQKSEHHNRNFRSTIFRLYVVSSLTDNNFLASPMFVYISLIFISPLMKLRDFYKHAKYIRYCLADHSFHLW